jgi:hypothetical protein
MMLTCSFCGFTQAALELAGGRNGPVFFFVFCFFSVQHGVGRLSMG